MRLAFCDISHAVMKKDEKCQQREMGVESDNYGKIGEGRMVVVVEVGGG